MDTIRQQKISRLLLKELSNVFLSDVKPLFGKALITVTNVRVSPDLSMARVYVSIFGVPDKNSIFEDIQIHYFEIKKMLVARVGKQIRIMPEMKFFIDDSLDYIEKIENALKK